MIAGFCRVLLAGFCLQGFCWQGFSFCFRFLSVNAKLPQEKLQKKNSHSEGKPSNAKLAQGKLWTRETSKLEAKPCRNLHPKGKNFLMPAHALSLWSGEFGLSKGPPQDGAFCFRFLFANEKFSQEKLQRKGKLRCLPTRCRKGAESPNWAQQGSCSGRGFCFRFVSKRRTFLHKPQKKKRKPPSQSKT